MPRYKNLTCCCRFFPLTFGVYLIAFHTMLHGAAGTCFVVTSIHKPKYPILNHLTTASYVSLIPIGIGIFWAVIFKNRKLAVVSGIFLAIASVLNIVSTFVYFIVYINFKANSLADTNMFWSEYASWTGKKHVPFTLWHFFTTFFIIITPLWWYYSAKICRYANMLKYVREERVNESATSQNFIAFPVAPLFSRNMPVDNSKKQLVRLS